MEFNFDKVAGKDLDNVKSNYKYKWNKSGIYAITVDNKVLYVGRAVDMGKRIQYHISHCGSAEKKYKILEEIRLAGYNIEFKVLEYTKDINEREAYYINYYLPPLNKQIPKHKDFEKQENVLGQVIVYQDALRLAKEV